MLASKSIGLLEAKYRIGIEKIYESRKNSL